MKGFRLISWLLVLVLISLCSCQQDVSIDRLKFLGTDKFSQDKWLVTSETGRGRMVYDLIKNHKVMDVSRDRIIEMLGTPTAYYEYDEFPAYLVGYASATEVEGDSYVLAFLVNHSTGKTYKFVLDSSP